MGIAIEVLPIGPVAVASRVWRHRGRRLFTAVVKATFALQHDGPMTILPPAPIVAEERHYRGNPVASLIHASDMALLVPKPEVVVVGAAYAGPGQTTPQATVRLAVQRDTTILINKRLEITGDRRAKPGASPPDPAPFEKMPIRYELARGGIAARDNPVGVGMAVDPDGLLTLPNVNLSSQGGVNPAGLGPIPSAWPLRQKKRGSLSWTAANLSPDVDVPNDFDDAYYQTAPSDQQTSELRAGDVIAIVNMHPDLGLVRTYLPNARGVALAQTSRGDRLPLNLRIDTVHIEPDAMRAEILFRGAAVVEESDLADLRLAGAIEQSDAPFVFPDLSTVSGLVARRTDAATATPNFETTAVIAEPITPEERAAAARALHPSGPPPPPNHERLGRAGTMVMEPEEEPRRPLGEDKRNPVFGPPPAGVYAGPPSAPQAMRPPTESDSGERRATTAVIEPEPPRSLPFDKGHFKNVPTTAPSRDGTPWAVAPPHELSFEAVDEGTLDAPPEKPVTMEVPISSDSASREVDSNAETPRRPTPAEAQAPPVSASVPITPPNSPQPTPRTNLKRDLYKKMKR